MHRRQLWAVAALVAALRKVMQDPLHAADMGRLGRQRVEQQFSVEREAEGVAAVYGILSWAFKSQSNREVIREFGLAERHGFCSSPLSMGFFLVSLHQFQAK
jgi:hypothetical protein